jgi:hypothetical protein
MQKLFPILIALTVLAPAARAQKATVPAWASVTPAANAVITWTRVPQREAGPDGRVIAAKTIHEGGGRPSKPYDSLLFKGTAETLPRDTRLFAFLIAGDEDAAAVSGYLASNRPRDWDLLPTDSPWRTGMKPRERFMELGLSEDGTIILTLDAYEHPDCMQLTAIVITDSTGRVLDRLDRK